METERQPDKSERFVIKDRVLKHHGKFLNFYEVNFVNAHGKDTIWEMVGRDANDVPDRYNIQKNFGGVDVISIAIQPKDGDLSIAQPGEQIVLIEKIFRVPVMNYVLELPAGFKDGHESDPVESALRELKEETGYIGENGRSSKTCYTDPWKSDERGVIVSCDVDLSKEENKNPVTELEDAEDITCMWVKVEGLRQKLEDLSKEHKCEIDQRLYNWALGIELAYDLDL